jgi:hypothetical protein
VVHASRALIEADAVVGRAWLLATARSSLAESMSSSRLGHGRYPIPLAAVRCCGKQEQRRGMVACPATAKVGERHVSGFRPRENIAHMLQTYGNQDVRMLFQRKTCSASGQRTAETLNCDKSVAKNLIDQVIAQPRLLLHHR